jgi:hypothetical protein
MIIFRDNLGAFIRRGGVRFVGVEVEVRAAVVFCGRYIQTSNAK